MAVQNKTTASGQTNESGREFSRIMKTPEMGQGGTHWGMTVSLEDTKRASELRDAASTKTRFKPRCSF
jgi:hypothetical protein